MIRGRIWKALLTASVCTLAISGAAIAQTRSFEVPAGDLKAALDAYIRQSGAQLIYRSDEVRGRKTAGVHGVLSSSDALSQLLAGSDLVVSRDASGAAVVSTRPKSAEPAEAQSAPSLGEVIVTATRREEKVRDVAGTVNALSGDQLRATGQIVSTGDVLTKFAGVRFNNLSSPQLSEITMRGSGTQRATNADTAIGLFANGVYIGDSASSFGRNFTPLDSFDLARAEVLEGPQGGLYGKNAEFGVVNLVSQQAKFSDEGIVDVVQTFKLGNTRETAVFNHAFSDQIAGRIAVQGIQQTSGFVYDPDTDKYFDDTHGWMARAQLRYASGPLDVSLVGAMQRLHLPSYANVITVAPNTNTNIPTGYLGSRYVINAAGDGTAREDVDNVMLLASYDMGWAKLSSTSSYRNRNDIENRGYAQFPIDLALEAQLQAMGNKGAYPLASAKISGRTKSAYQEVHLSGLALEDRLNWLVGAEYVHSSGDNLTLTATDPCNAGAPTIGVSICGGTPTQPTCTPLTSTSKTCPPTTLGYGSDAYVRKISNSWATYISLTYKLPYNFTLSGDVRFNDDHKDYTQRTYSLYTTNFFNFATGGAKAPLAYSYKKEIVTYTTTLSYKVPGAWNDLLYAKIGTGYRSGDFNSGVSPPLINGKLGTAAPPAGYTPALPTYGDETVTSYEAGFKGNITPRFYVAMDVFTSRLSNALTQVSDGCATTNACLTAATVYVANVGASKATGIEGSLDTAFQFAGGSTRLHVSGSEQTSSYADVPVGPGLPISGSQVPQTPHYLASAALDNNHPLGNRVEGFVNVSWNGQWGGIQDPATSTLDAVRLSNFQDVNLRMGIDYQAVEVALAARNLTNERHTLFSAVSNASIGPLRTATTPTTLAQRWNEPRTFAVEVKYKW